MNQPSRLQPPGRPTVLALLCLALLAAAAPAPQPVPFEIPYARIQSTEINESSGLVASRQYPGVLWTHNDSGDSARIFAIDQRGALLAELPVEGANNRDWEDIAIDDAGNLYLGDIGNNANQRTDLAVYVVEEPDPQRAASARVKRTLRFRFPELPYPPPSHRKNFDAESLFWTGDQLYLLSKHRSNTFTTLYRFPSLAGERRVTLERLAEFNLGGSERPRGGMATAADITPDGRTLALLSYHALFLFDWHEEHQHEEDYFSNVRRIELSEVTTRQCESVTWVGDDLIVGNEQRQLHRIAQAATTELRAYPP